jgi:hypothetical protein
VHVQATRMARVLRVNVFMLCPWWIDVQSRACIPDASVIEPAASSLPDGAASRDVW